MRGQIVRKALVTVFGLGYLPIAPGTWGSGGACAVALAVFYILGPGLMFHLVLAGLVLLAVVGSVLLGDWAIQYYASKDPKPFVLDEAAGQWLALLALPLRNFTVMLVAIVLQFLLFRVADIIKPSPARRLERLPGGWGIVCDDLAAGLYANIIGQVILRFLWVPS